MSPRYDFLWSHDAPQRLHLIAQERTAFSTLGARNLPATFESDMSEV